MKTFRVTPLTSLHHNRALTGALLVGVISSLFTSLLMPVVEIMGRSIRPEDVAALFLFVLLGTITLSHWRRGEILSVPHLAWFLVACVVWGLAAMTWGYLRLNVAPTPLDLVELTGFIKMAVWFMAAVLVVQTDLGESVAWRGAQIVIGLVVILAILQYHDVANVTDWFFTKVYYTKQEMVQRGGVYHRALGTIANPNHLAIPLLLAVAGVMGHYLFSDSWTKWAALGWLSLSTYAVFLTMSRAALIGLLVLYAGVLLTVGMQRFLHRPHRLRELLGIFLCTLFVASIAPQHLYTRFTALVVPQRLSSTRHVDRATGSSANPAPGNANPSLQTISGSASSDVNSSPGATDDVTSATVSGAAEKVMEVLPETAGNAGDDKPAKSVQSDSTEPARDVVQDKIAPEVQEEGTRNEVLRHRAEVGGMMGDEDGASITVYSTSLAAKLKRWLEIWARIKESPFFGWGPSRSWLLRSVDNQYLQTWVRYGFVGLVLFVVPFFVIWVYSLKLLVRNLETTITNTALAAFLFLPALGVLSLNAEHLMNRHIMPVTWTLMGMVYGLWLRVTANQTPDRDSSIPGGTKS